MYVLYNFITTLQSSPVDSTKNMQRFSVKFGWGSNLGLLLTQGVSGVCPEEMVGLSGLFEFHVVELSGDDCTGILYKIQE